MQSHFSIVLLVLGKFTLIGGKRTYHHDKHFHEQQDNTSSSFISSNQQFVIVSDRAKTGACCCLAQPGFDSGGNGGCHKDTHKDHLDKYRYHSHANAGNGKCCRLDGESACQSSWESFRGIERYAMSPETLCQDLVCPEHASLNPLLSDEFGRQTACKCDDYYIEDDTNRFEYDRDSNTATGQCLPIKCPVGARHKGKTGCQCLNKKEGFDYTDEQFCIPPPPENMMMSGTHAGMYDCIDWYEASYSGPLIQATDYTEIRTGKEGRIAQMPKPNGPNGSYIKGTATWLEVQVRFIERSHQDSDATWMEPHWVNFDGVHWYDHGYQTAHASKLLPLCVEID